jgi:organic hydroperoxide reductase OsmC/OhrA
LSDEEQSPHRTHTYRTTVRWTGDRGDGTKSYAGYDRAHETLADGRPTLEGSSDPAFRGDPSRWNPELLLLASASQCHMLWYLHLATTRQVVVTAYEDTAEGLMREDEDGGGRFVAIILRPVVTVSESSMVDAAEGMHADASARCFIANSLNFEVRHSPTTRIAEP